MIDSMIEGDRKNIRLLLSGAKLCRAYTNHLLPCFEPGIAGSEMKAAASRIQVGENSQVTANHFYGIIAHDQSCRALLCSHEILPHLQPVLSISEWL